MTYGVIMLINKVSELDNIRNGWRKIVTLIVGSIAGIIFYKTNMSELKVIIPSFLLSQFGYSYFIKYIFEFLKIDYDRHNI